MIKSKINVGIVGVGRTGSEHLNFYKKNKNVLNIYISEKNKLNIKKNSKITIDPELKLFKRNSKKKLLSISNFDYDHFKYLIKNYERNHIFVEKPMCYSFEELKRIFQASKKKKI